MSDTAPAQHEVELAQGNLRAEAVLTVVLDEDPEHPTPTPDLPDDGSPWTGSLSASLPSTGPDGARLIAFTSALVLLGTGGILLIRRRRS